MRPLLHPCLLNGRKGDPALYIETLFEKHAVLFDLGDLSNLPPRKIQRFENAIGLGAFGFRARVVDVLDGEIKLVIVMLGIAAIFSAGIGQHALELDALLIEEGDDAIDLAVIRYVIFGACCVRRNLSKERRYGEPIRDTGAPGARRCGQAADRQWASSPSSLHGRSLRLSRMRRERGSVDVVSPASSPN
jgi:hypothetical protein